MFPFKTNHDGLMLSKIGHRIPNLNRFCDRTRNMAYCFYEKTKLIDSEDERNIQYHVRCLELMQKGFPLTKADDCFIYGNSCFAVGKNKKKSALITKGVFYREKSLLLGGNYSNSLNLHIEILHMYEMCPEPVLPKDEHIKCRVTNVNCDMMEAMIDAFPNADIRCDAKNSSAIIFVDRRDLKADLDKLVSKFKVCAENNSMSPVASAMAQHGIFQTIPQVATENNLVNDSKKYNNNF